MKRSLKILLVAGLFFLSGKMQSQNLQEYLRLAEDNNPGIKAAYASFEAALQEAPQVKSLPSPTLTVAAFGNMIEPGMGAVEARFQLMQMFPWFGTLRAREDVANLLAEAEFQNYLDVRNALFFEVSRKFYELYELRQQEIFQQDNQEILQNYKDLALSRVSSGSGALTDVLQADLLRNESETALKVLEFKREALVAQFNALLNRSKNEPVDLPEELKIPSESDFMEIAVVDNPQLAQLDRMQASAQAREVLARKEGLPQMGIGLDYMLMSESENMAMEEGGGDAVMPMISVSLPIFRGKHKAARKQAAFMAEGYQQQKINVRNMLSQEMEAAVFQVKEQMAVLDLYKKQVESSQQVLNLLLSSYQNSSSAGFEQVLKVRQELLNYQLAMAGAQTKYLTALARIDYLSGKNEAYENND